MTAVPAMVNAHSHAFQRDLRGRAEAGSGDFWTWRTEMFRAAAALDPDTMRDVAERAYREMRAAGYGVVGEFHYVHHRPDGTPYDEPNALAVAVAEGAMAAGLAVVLIPAAYHRNGHDGVVEDGQRRFCDPDVETYLARVDALRSAGVSVAVAAHSVRAVPADWLSAIAAYADEHGLPRHVHAHEQRRELEECAAEHGCTPIALLERTGFLGPRTSLIHGIHVSSEDVATLGRTDTIVVACPTTEGNLGDGHLPAAAYRAAGVRLAIGSDSNVRIDPFEEARELETGARREAETRTGLGGDLWAELAANGRASLGVTEAPTIEVDRSSPELAGVSDADLARALVASASARSVQTPAPPPTAADWQ
jgi:formimidoylglutamate deiminase